MDSKCMDWMRLDIWVRSESLDKHVITMAQTVHLMKIHIPFVLIATKYHTPFDQTETSILNGWRWLTHGKQKRLVSLITIILQLADHDVCLGVSHIDRHAFRREKVLLECGMRICYLVKNGALKTHFAGVMISEQPAINYNSQLCLLPYSYILTSLVAYELSTRAAHETPPRWE
jgi:hypothetical protein